MADTKLMQPDVAKALKALKPLRDDEQLPSHYRHKVVVLMRGLEVLGTELGRREQGAAKAMRATSNDPSIDPFGLTGAQNGNQGA